MPQHYEAVWFSSADTNSDQYWSIMQVVPALCHNFCIRLAAAKLRKRIETTKFFCEKVRFSGVFFVCGAGK